MKDKLTIKSISPVVAGWWAKFIDNDEMKTEWYSPVAAWALCDVKFDKQADICTQILPVLTLEFGMAPLHPGDGYCELLYLPDDKFTRTDEHYCFAWKMISGMVGSPGC